MNSKAFRFSLDLGSIDAVATTAEANTGASQLRAHRLALHSARCSIRWRVPLADVAPAK